MKPNYSIRLDKLLVLEARSKGINLADLFHDSLTKAISTKACPTCGKKKNGRITRKK